MSIGDLIEYKHDGSRGMVIEIDDFGWYSTDRVTAALLVLWSPEVSERYQLDRAIWWVDVDLVEVTK